MGVSTSISFDLVTPGCCVKPRFLWLERLMAAGNRLQGRVRTIANLGNLDSAACASQGEGRKMG
jgi:hypothetical protein